MEPSVDIIIPTHNRPALTAEAIRSVQGQTYEGWRLFVVDDHSEVSAYDELVRLIPDDDRIRLVRRPRSGGPQAARQTGWELSDAPYVAILDSDDLWVATKLEKQLRMLSQGHGDPPVDIVLCWHYWVGRGRREGPKRPRERSDGSILVTTNMSTPLIRREAIARIGGFVTEGMRHLMTSGGVEFHLRLAPNARFAVVEEPLVFCRHHGASRTSDGFKSAASAEDLAYLIRLHEETLARYPADRGLLMARLSARYLGAGDHRRGISMFRSALATSERTVALSLAKKYGPYVLKTVALRRLRPSGSAANLRGPHDAA